MSGIRIRTRNADVLAELDGSDVSNAIWLSLPFRAQTNMLGSQIYFEMAVDAKVEGELRTVFEKGDIAYWPKVEALCIFYGPTPLSGEDGRPVSRYPLVKIGELKGEYSVLDEAGDRQNITLERAF